LLASFFACKNDGLERKGGVSSKTSNTKQVYQSPEAIETQAKKIPRIEYPGDPSQFPPLEVGEEASIATDITGTYLTLPKGLTEAGQAVAIRSAAKISDTMLQTVKVVLPKSKLSSEENLVVIYRMTNDKGENFVGLIPRKDLEIEDHAVTVHPRGLGVYQAAVTPVFVGDERKVPLLDANAPRLRHASTYNTSGNALDIHLDGNTAYVADGDAVEVLNWSPTSGLTANTRVPGTGTINAILKGGNRIYVAAGTAGLGVIDVPQGLTLQMADARGITNGIAAAVNLNNIYLTQESTGANGSRAGISRFDIQEAEPNYEVTGNVTPPGGNPQIPYGIQIAGTVAYTISRSGVYTYDITQNDRMNLIGQLSLNGTGEKLTLQGTRIYAAERSEGVIAVDASNPRSLVVLNRLNLPNVIDVSSNGSFLVAIDTNRKVSLIDISDPSHMLLLSQLTLPSLPTRVKKFGDIIFATMGEGGVAVLTIETAP
jgi:hypothetical protein